jgi:hypothetical protein
MMVELQLSFPEFTAPASPSPVWTALDEGKQAEVVAVLARLIAKVVAEQHPMLAIREVATDE